MLKFNSFRPDRYLRSLFVEGRYLLASEASDLELEIADNLRKAFKVSIGNIAIGDAWKVTRQSATQLLVSPGEAWFEGLIYELRNGADWILTAGTVPLGVTILDSPTGIGKLITFPLSTPSVPSANYRLVITASEQVITNVQDPFLQNVNIPEPTSSKIRLVYTLNVVVASNQGVTPNYDTSSPIPYQGEIGAASVVNLSNTIKITPSGTSGYLISLVDLLTSQQIDGRSAELTIKNPTGANPFPTGTADQATFENGTLIDAYGNEYHINSIFNGVVSDETVIRISREVGQSDPLISNITGSNTGSSFVPYYIKKQNVYYTDDTTGTPTGKLHWHIAEANWNTTNGFVHDSSLKDLRDRVLSEADFETAINTKLELVLTGGGIIGVDVDGQTLNWDTAFQIVNPAGPTQTINSGSAILLNGGSLVYSLNLVSGGVISVGNLAVTSTTTGTSISLSGSPDLSLVKIGNTINIGTDVAQITAVDNVLKTLTVTPSLPSTGSGFIYRDSFAAGTAILNEKSFTLAVSKSGKIVVGGILTLGPGETNAIYDELINYPTGYPALTNITLPNNSATSKPQYYNVAEKNLEIFINDLAKVQGVNWSSVDSQTIQLTAALPNNSQLRFRIDSTPSGSIGGGSGGGGSATLQNVYDNGNTITTTSGVPVIIGGPSGEKLLVVNGDVQIDGVLDPTAVQLTPEASNPLAGGQQGIWVNTSDQLIFETGSGPQNISSILVSTITNVVAGAGLTGGGSGPTSTINVATADASLVVNTNDIAVQKSATGAIGLAGDGLKVNVDNSTIEINTDALQVKDLGITTAKLNNSAVIDAKVATGISAAKISSGVVSNTEFDYLDGVTSSIQTQIDSKQATGNYITGLIDDVTASGPGSVSATVNSVGGSTAADINTAEIAANAATDVNTPSTIVKRDALGDFSAGIITADLTGTASNNAYTSLDNLTVTGLSAADLLVASSSSAVDRLAIGSTDQVLTVVAGLPTWAALPPTSLAVYKTDWLTAEGTVKVIIHGLGSTDIQVSIIDLSTNEIIGIDTIEITSSSIVTLTASEAPSSDWRIIIQAL